MPRKGYKQTPEHTEKLAAQKRGKPRSPETIAKMSAGAMGNLVGEKNGRYRPVEERFWEKVDRSGECWEWTGARDGHGYGMFQRAARDCRRAHRVSWELTSGDIPDGLYVLHSCDNPPCVNPAHLRIGTNADNMRDMWTRGRR